MIKTMERRLTQTPTYVLALYRRRRHVVECPQMSGWHIRDTDYCIIFWPLNFCNSRAEVTRSKRVMRTNITISTDIGIPASSTETQPFYLFIYWRLIAQSTAQGFSQVQISHKLTNSNTILNITLHKHKTCKHNPKVSLFGIALAKNGK